MLVYDSESDSYNVVVYDYESDNYNEQVYDNAINGITSTTLTDQVSSAQKTYPTTPAGEYDIDDISKNDVLDMDINDTDIYGSYY